MSEYSTMSKAEAASLLGRLQEEYAVYQKKGLKLDMSRGKPGADQLDLSMPLLDCVTSTTDCNAGTDCRNYGILDGLPEAKVLMGALLGVGTDEIIVGGNSSLNLMYDAIARAMTHGVVGSPRPWCMEPVRKFLCPVPGYDRHFAITEHFGFEMIPIEMTPTGPDMDAIEKLVSSDATIKGIWCVPMYSNPQGITYSSETVRRFAALKPLAPDFRIFWDNAYCVHHLDMEHQDTLDNILAACKEAGNPNMVYLFGSTSKISFPGAGVSAIGASKENIDAIKAVMTFQTIGHDKLNQLRHVRYFKDINGIMTQMGRHAAILAPKFAMVLNILEMELGSIGIARWFKPKGGYFIALDVQKGCAKRVVQLCKEAGVVLTPAGATYPYGNDPKDSNIRIAPTLPPMDELEKSTLLLCLCAKIAVLEQMAA